MSGKAEIRCSCCRVVGERGREIQYRKATTSIREARKQDPEQWLRAMPDRYFTGIEATLNSVGGSALIETTKKRQRAAVAWERRSLRSGEKLPATDPVGRTAVAGCGVIPSHGPSCFFPHPVDCGGSLS